ncbi:MAG: Gfo/Idh/MocA family oxidoreductase [Pirellulaceae bacterium]|nr:Gfo/Idh/MocA family oxidoreductase [Planctomycetales bacterium]
MKRLRIVVVGAGHLGRIHGRLLKTVDGAELVGVVDPVPAARDQVARELETTAYADIDQLPSNLDAAIIAAPTVHHHELATRLLKANLHLLIEKPLATTAQQARELVWLANERRRVLQVGHVERFNPAWNAARGQLGRVRYIEAKRESRHTFRSTDIGAVLDLMIHDIDLVLSLVKGDLVDVRAFGFSALGCQEDSAAAWLTFADGSQAHLSASRVAYSPQRAMRITSDEACAELDFAAGTARVIRPGESFVEHRGELQDVTVERRQHLQSELFASILASEELEVVPGNAILDEQHDFVISIRAKRAPMVTGEAGLAALEVAERVLSAMRISTWHAPRKAGTPVASPSEAPAALPMTPTPQPIHPHPRKRRRAG